jgi:hypothetical protein
MPDLRVTCSRWCLIHLASQMVFRWHVDVLWQWIWKLGPAKKFVVWFSFYGWNVFLYESSLSYGRTLWQWCNESAACQKVVQRLSMVKIQWIFNSSFPGCPHGLGSENFTFMCYFAMSISWDFCDYPCVYTHIWILLIWFYFMYYLVYIYVFNFSWSVIDIWFILLILYLQLCFSAGWLGVEIKVWLSLFTLQRHTGVGWWGVEV